MPSVLVGYSLPVLLMLVPTSFGLLSPSVAWQILSTAIALVILVASRMLSIRKTHKEILTQKPHLCDIPHLMIVYKAAVILSLAYHLLFISYAGYLYGSSLSMFSLSRLRAALQPIIGEEYLLATVVMILGELFKVIDLRRRGFTTTKEARDAVLTFLAAQTVLGPGAALAGLWWWREKKIMAPRQKFVLY